MKHPNKFGIPVPMIMGAVSFLIVGSVHADNFTYSSQSGGGNPQTWNSAVWEPGSLVASPGNTYEVLAGAVLENPPLTGIQTFPGDSLSLDAGSRFMATGYSS